MIKLLVSDFAEFKNDNIIFDMNKAKEKTCSIDYSITSYDSNGIKYYIEFVKETGFLRELGYLFLRLNGFDCK